MAAEFELVVHPPTTLSSSSAITSWVCKQVRIQGVDAVLVYLSL